MAATVKTGNPYIVTQADTSVMTTPARINYMEWFPTTTGDDIAITDNGSNTLWSLKAIAADSNQGIGYRKDFQCSVNGISVDTIDHGTLYIYFF
jgi:hypothetical protein